MKKVITYLSVSMGLLFGLSTVANVTTVKADSTLPAGRYAFAVTRTTETTDQNGNLTSTILPKGSSWLINTEYDKGDQTFFQLAPNIVVNLYAGYIYMPKVQDLKVISKGPASLYDHNGQLITDRVLAPGSEWYSDRVIFLDGETYYRVATDEFVLLSDVQEY